MERNLQKVFSLVEETPEQVIIKVLADDPLTIARYPFVDSEMAYITVTRGEEHILTVVKKDGKTYSFHWGSSGYTLISENMEELKKAVIEYIQDDVYILLERTGWEIAEAKIYYNDYYRKWQLTLEGKGSRQCAHWWSKTAESFEEMAAEVIPYVRACGWEPRIAVTGIQTWKAILD